jgi:hypothetical protein
MWIGQEWHQAFHRFITSPTLEVLAVIALVGVAMLSIAGDDVFFRTHRDSGVAVFGPR